MKKVLALVVLLGGLAALPGCFTESCQGDSRRFFDIQGLAAKNILREDTTLNCCSNNYLSADSVSTIEAKRFGIELESKVSFFAFSAMPVNPFGSAYACSPTIAGEMGSKEIIADIQITSNADFDSLHPTGTTLNDYFKVSAGGSNFNTLDDSLRSRAISLTDFIESSQKARRSLQLWLTKAPELSKQHRFTIKYTQTNGEEYIVKAPKAIFQ